MVPQSTNMILFPRLCSVSCSCVSLLGPPNMKCISTNSAHSLQYVSSCNCLFVHLKKKKYVFTFFLCKENWSFSPCIGIWINNCLPAFWKVIYKWKKASKRRKLVFFISPLSCSCDTFLTSYSLQILFLTKRCTCT